MPDRGVKEQERTKTKERVLEPPMFRVILLNDHYTSMEFVVEVLVTIFHKGPEEALQVMMSVHKAGSGVAGAYTREIAETKVASVVHRARRNGFPLQCVLEPM